MVVCSLGLVDGIFSLELSDRLDERVGVLHVLHVFVEGVGVVEVVVDLYGVVLHVGQLLDRLLAVVEVNLDWCSLNTFCVDLSVDVINFTVLAFV